MSTKYILPIGLLVAGAGAGYVIWRRVTAVPPQMMPGVGLPPPQPGIAVKSGRFDIFVPLKAIADIGTDIISAVTGGGTRPQAKTERPGKPEAIAGGTWEWTGSRWDWTATTLPTGPTLITEAGAGEPYIMPYMPGVGA